MRKAPHFAHTSALPAIAAALALSSIPALAQEAPAPSQPTTTEPTVSASPAPTVDAAPATTDTMISTPEVEPSTTTTAKPRHATAAAKAAPVTTSHKVAQTVTRTTHAAVPVAAAPSAAAKPTAPATAASDSVTPVVDMAKPTQPAPPAAATPANNGNETAMEIGGGALALLAIGAGAFALSRRRRRDDETVYDEVYEPETGDVAAEAEAMPQHDPIFDEQPPVVAPEASAFAWGNPQPAEQDSEDGSDRRPGETWVERAYRGPSPANPSVSLKARLRRAAFFDKRERDVAQGTAEPVDTDAGLPDAMVEDQAMEERELA